MMPKQHQCQQMTKRGRKCKRQAMHIVKHDGADRPLCQKHWMEYMDRRNA